MKKKKGLNKKEKREIALMIGAVAVVVLVGFFVTNMTSKRVEAVAGAAVQLNPDIPTYSGVLLLLQEHCSPVEGFGDCNTICGSQVCVPTERNCDENATNNQCLCCNYP